MATDGPVSRWNQLFYNASDERLLDSALMMPSGTSAFSARSGRRPGPGLSVTFSDLTATVAPGAGVIYDPTYGAGGPWRFVLPSSKTVTLDARPGTGLSRKDLIVARIYDADSSVGTVKELKIEAVKGDASATPSKPALPALSLELGVADVASGGAVSFTPNRARTVAAGGILPVATTAERDALPSPHAGLTVFNEQTGQAEQYDGTAWFVLAGGKKTYNPTWSTVTGAQPSIGNGTLTGEWTRVGDLVTFTIRLTFGSSSNAGANSWQFTLPSTPVGRTSFSGTVYDVSSDATHAIVGVTDTNKVVMRRSPGTGALVGMGQSAPFTWATNDTLEMTGTYRVAA